MKGRRRRRPPTRTSRPPRCVLPADRKQIVSALNLHCRPDARNRVSIDALRLRAAVLFAASAALRVSELCRLTIPQLLEDPSAGRWRLRSLVYLRPAQSKGRRVGPKHEQWESSGTIVVSDEARSALRAYIAELKRRGWCTWPPEPDQPLLVAKRRNARSRKAKKPAYGPLAVRTLQYQWQMFQKRTGIVSPYHFHDLRHTAMTQCAEVTNGNTKMVAEFGRCDPQTAERYIHFSPARLSELRNELAFR